jgi:hypothetical protein
VVSVGKINWCKPDRIRSTVQNLSGQRAHEMSPPTPNVFSLTVLGDLLGRLDPDPLRRGKQFEHICQWFLTYDPVYAHELRQVWLWDE